MVQMINMWEYFIFKQVKVVTFATALKWDMQPVVCLQKCICTWEKGDGAFKYNVDPPDPQLK